MFNMSKAKDIYAFFFKSIKKNSSAVVPMFIDQKIEKKEVIEVVSDEMKNVAEPTAGDAIELQISTCINAIDPKVAEAKFNLNLFGTYVGNNRWIIRRETSAMELLLFMLSLDVVNGKYSYSMNGFSSSPRNFVSAYNNYMLSENEYQKGVKFCYLLRELGLLFNIGEDELAMAGVKKISNDFIRGFAISIFNMYHEDDTHEEHEKKVFPSIERLIRFKMKMEGRKIEDTVIEASAYLY